MPLTDLIARVEAATGPDRELDAAIAPLRGLRIVDEGHPIGRACYDQNGHGVPLPSFTGSLDAAVTLVPSGWQWSVKDFQGAAPAIAVLGDGMIVRNGASPALALCAAALKSMKAGDRRG